ncbi:MAG: HNH endonuclease signature motif containing protein [Nostoc sp.]|uniref:HNH endonuclease n=1 Tax=Nostoc sp. TaxID=1180 RepID=UPI002FFBCC2E
MVNRHGSGICTHCGMYFRESDVLEIDYITPKSVGGKDEYKNLQILHRHCHDQKTIGLTQTIAETLIFT